MARTHVGLPAVSTRKLVPALAPYVAARLLMTLAVFAAPRLVHLLDEARLPAVDSPNPSAEEVERRMLEMSRR